MSVGMVITTAHPEVEARAFAIWLSEVRRMALFTFNSDYACSFEDYD